MFYIGEQRFYVLANFFMQQLPRNLQYYLFHTYLFAFHSMPAVVACSYFFRYLVVCR